MRRPRPHAVAWPASSHQSAPPQHAPNSSASVTRGSIHAPHRQTAAEVDYTKWQHSIYLVAQKVLDYCPKVCDQLSSCIASGCIIKPSGSLGPNIKAFATPAAATATLQGLLFESRSEGSSTLTIEINDIDEQICRESGSKQACRDRCGHLEAISATTPLPPL